MAFLPDGKHEQNFAQNFPLLLQFVDFSSGYHLTPSYHDYMEIIYAYQGRGIFRVSNRDYEIDEGDLVIVGNDEFHAVEPLPSTPLVVLVMHFMPQLIYEPGFNVSEFEYLGPFYDHENDSLRKIANNSDENGKIVQLIAEIHGEILSHRDYYQLAVKNHLHEILLILLRYHGKLEKGPESHYRRKYNVSRLNAVFSLLYGHYQNRITLDQAASLACMSHDYFCRFFKRITGYTFVDYLLRIRIDKARELLCNDHYTVAEVAFRVGFENHGYFDRMFKRMTGRSPLAYRNEYFSAAPGESKTK